MNAQEAQRQYLELCGRETARVEAVIEALKPPEPEPPPEPTRVDLDELKRELSMRCTELEGARREIARLTQELAVVDTLRNQIRTLQNELVKTREDAAQSSTVVAILKRKFSLAC
jgi:flagellar motility protein MotE (MotC chaperone)